MTQVELAVAIGIERGTLAGIEVGAASPGRTTLAALAAEFDVSMDYIEGRPGASGKQAALDPQQAEQDAAILRVWHLLDKTQRDSLLAIMEGLVGVTGPARHGTAPALDVDDTLPHS